MIQFIRLIGGYCPICTIDQLCFFCWLVPLLASVAMILRVSVIATTGSDSRGWRSSRGSAGSPDGVKETPLSPLPTSCSPIEQIQVWFWFHGVYIMYMNMYTYTYKYIYTIYVHINVYVCVYVYKYIYVYVLVISAEFWQINRLNVNRRIDGYWFNKDFMTDYDWLLILLIKKKKLCYRWIDAIGGLHDW